MKKVTIFVGLDYHQSAVQVCLLDRKGNVLANGTRGNSWEEIAASVPAGVKIQAAIEACCGAADLAEELVTRAGWSVSLAHPGYVARMKQSPDKTDFSDARVLADLVRVGYLPRVWLAPAELRDLRRLVRRRQQLVQDRRSTKLRIRALLRDSRVKGPAANPWTKAWLDWLRTTQEVSPQTRWIIDNQLDCLKFFEEQIRVVEKQLAAVTKEDTVVQGLLEEDGVGLVTAATLRAEIGHFDRFRTGKQLSKFCGLSPRNASSGPRQADAGLIKAGNAQLRAVLIETAHRLVMYQERWGQLADKLRQERKPGSVIAAAVANRWVRWLHYRMTSLGLAC
jgi:transposase